MAPPPTSPPAPRSPPISSKHRPESKGSSVSSRRSIDKTLPGLPGLPTGAAPPSMSASAPILYPPVPVPTTAWTSASTPVPPNAKVIQYPMRPANQLPPGPPLVTSPATSPSSAAPSRLTSLSSSNSKYAPSPLGNAPGAPSPTRQPSSTSTTGQSSGDEGLGSFAEKLRKRKKTSKNNKGNSEDMSVPPVTLPVRYPSMVLSRLVREEAESAANSSWIGVPPQRSSTVPANLGASRPGSMILYRLADEEDRAWANEGQLSRPASYSSLAPPPGGRFTANRMSVSPSYDSKYPNFTPAGDGSPTSTPPLPLPGYATPPGSRPNSAYRNSSGTPPPGSTPLSQGVFLPYEYDPAEDEAGPNDEVDELHHVVLELGSDGKYKFPREPMADVNVRGLMNVICVIFVISAILAVFLAYPVVDSVQRQKFWEAAQQGAVIVNPVGPKDGTSSVDTDGSLTSTDDPLTSLTSQTRTRNPQTTAVVTQTDENGAPIQTDPVQTDPGLPTPTPTPTLAPVPTPTPTPNTPIVDPNSTLDPGTLRKRTPQPTILVIAARRQGQARS